MNDLSSSARPSAKPFTRIINTPPAWPWDQTRAATLEAQHTSPVSGDDVNIVVRRLAPWSMGQAGKFVAAYLRGVDIRQGLKFDLDIQGQRILIDMPSPQARRDKALDRAWIIAFATVLALSLFGTSWILFDRSAAESEQLQQLERVAARSAREASGVTRAKADAQALEDLNLSNRTFDNVLADMRTVTVMRDRSARITAFFWNKGYWAIEVRGTEAPFKDATIPVQRSAKPVRKGTWLWVSAVEDGQ